MLDSHTPPCVETVSVWYDPQCVTLVGQLANSTNSGVGQNGWTSGGAGDDLSAGLNTAVGWWGLPFAMRPFFETPERFSSFG